MDYQQRDRTRERGWNDPPTSLLNMTDQGLLSVTGLPEAAARPTRPVRVDAFQVQPSLSAPSGALLLPTGVPPPSALDANSASAGLGNASAPPPGLSAASHPSASAASIAATTPVDQSALHDSLRVLVEKCPAPSASDMLAVRKSHDDMKRRVGILLQKAANKELSNPTSLLLLKIANELNSGDYERASETHVDLVTKHYDEASSWIVGVKRLITELKALAASASSPAASSEAEAQAAAQYSVLQT